MPDEQTPDTSMTAYGAFVGALSYAPEKSRVISHITLGRGAEDHPRLFVRFPGRLESTYEVTITPVPDTEVPMGSQPITNSQGGGNEESSG